MSFTTLMTHGPAVHLQGQVKLWHHVHQTEWGTPPGLLWVDDVHQVHDHSSTLVLPKDADSDIAQPPLLECGWTVELVNKAAKNLKLKLKPLWIFMKLALRVFRMSYVMVTTSHHYSHWWLRHCAPSATWCHCTSWMCECSRIVLKTLGLPSPVDCWSWCGLWGCAATASHPCAWLSWPLCPIWSLRAWVSLLAATCQCPWACRGCTLKDWGRIHLLNRVLHAVLTGRSTAIITLLSSFLSFIKTLGMVLLSQLWHLVILDSGLHDCTAHTSFSVIVLCYKHTQVTQLICSLGHNWRWTSTQSPWGVCALTKCVLPVHCSGGQQPLRWYWFSDGCKGHILSQAGW